MDVGGLDRGSRVPVLGPVAAPSKGRRRPRRRRKEVGGRPMAGSARGRSTGAVLRMEAAAPSGDGRGRAVMEERDRVQLPRPARSETAAPPCLGKGVGRRRPSPAAPSLGSSLGQIGPPLQEPPAGRRHREREREKERPLCGDCG
ncbi:unnamed protein product [Urochloa humidicola]